MHWDRRHPIETAAITRHPRQKPCLDRGSISFRYESCFRHKETLDPEDTNHIVGITGDHLSGVLPEPQIFFTALEVQGSILRSRIPSESSFTTALYRPCLSVTISSPSISYARPILRVRLLEGVLLTPWGIRASVGPQRSAPARNKKIAETDVMPCSSDRTSIGMSSPCHKPTAARGVA